MKKYRKTMATLLVAITLAMMGVMPSLAVDVDFGCKYDN